MNRERGFHLVELMAVIGVLTVAALAIGGVLEGVQRDNRLSEAYTRDVRGLRRAVRTLEDDLREAKRIEGRTIDGNVYELRGDRLSRNGHLLADNVESFELDRDGDLVTVRLELGRRSGAPSRRRAVVATSVRLRGER